MADRKRKRYVARTAFVAVLVFLGRSAVAEESVVLRNLEFPKLQSENVVSVPLDAAALARAADDSADPRIVDPRGQAVPYRLRR